MSKLLVYADFDWMDSPISFGTLWFELSRGWENYSFEFASSWLDSYPGLCLSPDLESYLGRQFCENKADLFLCFSDCLPDRWGQLLIKRKERWTALSENRAERHLFAFDYLVALDDCSRMGGFRFKETEDGDYINSAPHLKIPPLSDLNTLLDATRELEKSEKSHICPQSQWLDKLLRPGSSLGGARPKASVIGKDGSLYIAKFPSIHDDYDAGLWEHLYHLLAKKCGIRCSETSVIEAPGGRHTLLSKRFDRIGEKRRHFASAMSLLGLRDGAGGDDGYGYIDMAEFILQSCRNTEANLEELYRRVAFNILTVNTDDHLRNHGFILHRDGWELSPAYDMNPGKRNCQSLLINGLTDEPDIGILLKSAESYYLSQSTAKRVVEEVREGLSDWKRDARRIGILSEEMRFIGVQIDERLRSFSTVKTTVSHPSS